MVQCVIAKLDRDVRNEMHSLMAMLELVAEAPLTESQYEDLRSCKSSADCLLRYVQNVCQFVCPETSKPQLSEIDLQEVVTDTAGLMEDLAQRNGLSLMSEIRSGTPTRVTGDRHRLEDILVRLIDNSIKFTDQGSIQLIMTKRENDSDRSRIEFIVCDSSRGIPQDTITRVLHPVAPDLGDHGLGLPIVHQLVRGMGGELSISRQDEGGSRVTVSLHLKASDVLESPELSSMEHTQVRLLIPTFLCPAK